MTPLPARRSKLRMPGFSNQFSLAILQGGPVCCRNYIFSIHHCIRRPIGHLVQERAARRASCWFYSQINSCFWGSDREEGNLQGKRKKTTDPGNTQHFPFTSEIRPHINFYSFLTKATYPSLGSQAILSTAQYNLLLPRMTFQGLLACLPPSTIQHIFWTAGREPTAGKYSPLVSLQSKIVYKQMPSDT